MSPFVSPDRHSREEDIQKQQNAVDGLDGKADGKTDLAHLTPNQRDQLKQTYFDRVNALQGGIRRSMEKIRIQKNERTEQWREWEAAVLGVERDLSLTLGSSIVDLKDPQLEQKTMETVAAFNAHVDRFLASLEQAEKRYQPPKDSVDTHERQDVSEPLSTMEIFTEWGVKITDSAFSDQIHDAEKRYGAARIRDIGALLSMYERLPANIRTNFFGINIEVDRAQVAGQLINGTLEGSPLGVAFCQPRRAIEQKLATLREQHLDTIASITGEVNVLDQQTMKSIVKLCGVTKEKVGGGTISEIVAWAQGTNGYPEIQAQIVRIIQDLSKKTQALRQKSDELSIESREIDGAFRSLDTTIAHQDGRRSQESQLLFMDQINAGSIAQIAPDALSTLRTSQREMLEGNATNALHSSIDEYNRYVSVHSELDILDRTDVLRLTGSKKFENSDATVEQRRDPMSIFGLRDSGIRGQDARGANLFPSGERNVSTLTSTGRIVGGMELVIAEVSGSTAKAKEHVLAFKGKDGKLRLQDGSELPGAVELSPRTIDISHAEKRTVYVAPDAERLLNAQIGMDPRRRITLREEPRASYIQSPIAMGNFTVLDASQLQIAQQNDDGTLQLFDANGKLESSMNAERLRKESAEHGGDVLDAVDHHPTVSGVMERAGTLQQNMVGMQTMLQTGLSADAYPGDAFVNQLRSFARPMLQTLEDPKTLEDVKSARELLTNELKRLQFGSIAGAGMERELQRRIASLDGYIKTLSDPSLLNAVQSAMALRPNTWEAWRSKDGLILLASVVAAVAATAALTFFTGGAFLLTLPGILAASATGAAAGIVGAEGAKELLYQYHNRWGGASNGQYRYTDGSRLLNYLRDHKIYDAETQQFVNMGFLKDVANPYAQEFFYAFMTSAAAMGVGTVAGKFLSTLAQNSTIVHKLAENSVICNAIMKKMSGLTYAAKQTQSFEELIKDGLKEFISELNDEILENGVSVGLSRFDKRLAFLGTFAVSAAKGFRPLRGGNIGYDSRTSTAEVRAWALDQGYNIVSERKGIFDVKTTDGSTLIIGPDRRLPNEGPPRPQRNGSNPSTPGSGVDPTASKTIDEGPGKSLPSATVTLGSDQLANHGEYGQYQEGTQNTQSSSEPSENVVAVRPRNLFETQYYEDLYGSNGGTFDTQPNGVDSKVSTPNRLSDTRQNESGTKLNRERLESELLDRSIKDLQRKAIFPDGSSYETKRIGKGGFGAVYELRVTTPDQQVHAFALKVLDPVHIKPDSTVNLSEEANAQHAALEIGRANVANELLGMMDIPSATRDQAGGKSTNEIIGVLERPKLPHIAELQGDVTTGELLNYCRDNDAQITRIVSKACRSSPIDIDADAFARDVLRGIKAAAPDTPLRNVLDQALKPYFRPTTEVFTAESFYALSELSPGGITAKRINTTTLSQAGRLAMIDRELSALVGTSESGAVSRDVKPENFLIDPSGKIKAIDLGINAFEEYGPRSQRAEDGSRVLSDRVSSMDSKSSEWTPYYFDPAIDTGKNTETLPTYQMGLIALETLTGRKVYKQLQIENTMKWENFGEFHKNVSALLKRPNILQDYIDRQPELQGKEHAKLRGLLKSMLDVNPENRPSLREAQEEFRTIVGEDALEQGGREFTQHVANLKPATTIDATQPSKIDVEASQNPAVTTQNATQYDSSEQKTASRDDKRSELRNLQTPGARAFINDLRERYKAKDPGIEQRQADAKRLASLLQGEFKLSDAQVQATVTATLNAHGKGGTIKDIGETGGEARNATKLNVMIRDLTASGLEFDDATRISYAMMDAGLAGDPLVALVDNRRQRDVAPRGNGVTPAESAHTLNALLGPDYDQMKGEYNHLVVQKRTHDARFQQVRGNLISAYQRYYGALVRTNPRECQSQLRSLSETGSLKPHEKLRQVVLEKMLQSDVQGPLIPAVRPKHPLNNPPSPKTFFATGDRVTVVRPGGEKAVFVVADVQDGVAYTISDTPGITYYQHVSVEQLKQWNPPVDFSRRPFAVGEEVYTIRNSGNCERGWIIERNPQGEYQLRNGAIVRDFDPSEAFHIEELELGRLPGSMHVASSARMIVKQHDVLRKSASLSEGRYHALFGGNLNQQNVGNCYLIGAFRAIQFSPLCETIMRTCVEEVSNGYIVRFPLGTRYDDQRSIFVNSADLKPQTVMRDGKHVQLRPVQSSIGWQVIEAAFAIDKFGVVDRSKMEGGLGSDALTQLFGPGVLRTTIDNQRGGTPDHQNSFAHGDASIRQNVLTWLNEFNNGKDIATVNTPRSVTGKDTEQFTVDRYAFYRNHAYAVQSVDKFARTITIANPHDTGKPMTLTYNQFLQAFSDISGVRFEYKNMFRGLTGVHRNPLHQGRNSGR